MRRDNMIAAGVAVIAAAGSAHADVVNLFFNAVNTQNATALSGFVTHGAIMDNMSLTVTFADLTTDTALWVDTGFYDGAAFGTGWTVSESGDTFEWSPWRFRNFSGQAIKSLRIDAGAGDTLFDTWFGGAGGTDGSGLGLDFAITSANQDFVVDANYTGEIGIGGNAPVGDLFRFLEIEWLAVGSAFADGLEIRFRQDTDNLLFAGELLIPLPTGAAMAMVGMGVIGLRRRRN